MALVRLVGCGEVMWILGFMVWRVCGCVGVWEGRGLSGGGEDMGSG